MSQRLRPTSRDYFVLKPKHSGFFDTTLDTLLASLGIRRVILTGLAGNICVLFTASRMRDASAAYSLASDIHAINANASGYGSVPRKSLTDRNAGRSRKTT